MGTINHSRMKEMSDMRRMATIAILLALGQTTAGFSKPAGPHAPEPTLKAVQPHAPESPAQTAAGQDRVNRYLKNKVASATLKDCWTNLTGEGVIATDLTFKKTGGAWRFEKAEVTSSTLPEGQAPAAVQCLQDAAQGTSFPVDPTAYYEKDAKELVLRWTWPVPLQGSDTRTAALINLTPAASAGGCVECSVQGGASCKSVSSGGYTKCKVVTANSCWVDPATACRTGTFR